MILLLLTCGILRAGDYREKLSAWVRLADAVENRRGQEAGKMRLAARGKHPRITAFVRITGHEQAMAAFAESDCCVLDKQGDICIVSMPIGSLPAIASQPFISRIEASRHNHLTMDTTATIVKADAAHKGMSLPQAYTGKGVVVGVMDVGFDLTHPNFFTSDASTYRIGALWDMLDKDTLGSAFPVGRDYVGYDAVLGKKHSADGLIETHGTHTLGIAAGSGYDSPYRGMAFESDICAVANAVGSNAVLIDSADLYKYTTAVDALGFKYIFDYAERQGKPAVASFSEGYHVGMDSEDSLFCDYLNRLTGPGRIIVASAGNESLKYSYLPKHRGQKEAGSYLRSPNKNGYLLVQADGPFTLSLAPGGYEKDAFEIKSTDAALDTLATYTHQGAETVVVQGFRFPSAFSPSDTLYFFALESSYDLNAAFPVLVVARGEESEVAVRAYSSSFFSNGLVEPHWADAEISHNVHAPACFPGIIAVGSTIHRTGFTNYQGRYYDYSQSGRNDGVWSQYSSVGPTLDGRIKPDVAAPGNNVISSYSSYYIEANPKAGDVKSDVAHFDFRGRTYAWNANTGTSMATPVVAGAVALWLQANPKLSPDDVMAVISKTSRRPEGGTSYPNNKYGHGEIDAYAGLLEVLGLSSIEGVEANNPAALRASFGEDGALVLTLPYVPDADAQITVYSLSGAVVCRKHLHLNSPVTRIEDTSALGKGVYLVQLTSEDKGMGGSLLLRR